MTLTSCLCDPGFRLANVAIESLSGRFLLSEADLNERADQCEMDEDLSGFQASSLHSARWHEAERTSIPCLSSGIQSSSTAKAFLFAILLIRLSRFQTDAHLVHIGCSRSMTGPDQSQARQCSLVSAGEITSVHGSHQ